MRPGYLTLSSPLLQPARPPTGRAQANNTTKHHVSATQKRIQKTTPMKRLTSERLLLCSGPGPPSGSAPVLTEQSVLRRSSVCETERGDTVLTLPRHNADDSNSGTKGSRFSQSCRRCHCLRDRCEKSTHKPPFRGRKAVLEIYNFRKHGHDKRENVAQEEEEE